MTTEVWNMMEESEFYVFIVLWGSFLSWDHHSSLSTCDRFVLCTQRYQHRSLCPHTLKRCPCCSYEDDLKLTNKSLPDFIKRNLKLVLQWSEVGCNVSPNLSPLVTFTEQNHRQTNKHATLLIRMNKMETDCHTPGSTTEGRSNCRVALSLALLHILYNNRNCQVPARSKSRKSKGLRASH